MNSQILEASNSCFRLSEAGIGRRQSAGTSEEETNRLNTFISSRVEKWNHLPRGKDILISKKISGLPRTIHVFKEGEKLQVMVRCKGILGKGTVKRIKTAVEWISGEKFARYIVGRTKRKMVETVMEGQKLHQLIAGKPGILSPCIGSLQYSKNLVELYNFYAPLREGTLHQLLNSPYQLSLQDKIDITEQILDALYFLEANCITHNDFHSGNLLYYRDDNSKLKVELPDFDDSQRIDDLYSTRQSRSEPDMWIDGDIINAADILKQIWNLDPHSKEPSLDTIDHLIWSMKYKSRTARQLLAELERIYPS